MNFLRSPTLLALPLALVLGVSSAHAQTPPKGPSAADQGAAQVLFDEGRKLMDAKSYGEACGRFEGSQRLDPQPGTQFNLAACYEKLGRLASAWFTYQEAAVASAAIGREGWAQKAKDKAAALDPRVPKLTILAIAPIPGFEVHRDGAPVASGALGVALPLDPGEHVVDATAPKKNKWQQKITITEGQRLEVKIPPLTDEAGEEPPPPPPRPLPPAPDTGSSSGTGLRIGGFVALGVGGASLVVGSILGGMAAGKKNDAALYCNPDLSICRSQGADLMASARTEAAVSTAMFVIAGLGVAAGITLIVLAPKGSSAAAPAPSARLGIGSPGSLMGLSLSGSF
jgi:hypothetical protein